MAKKTGLDKTSAARAAVERIRQARQERLKAARLRAAAAVKGASGISRKLPPAPAGDDDEGDEQPELTGKPGSVLELRHSREQGRGITYERKAVLCGKKGCNKLHGPYWYAFWSAGGKVRSVYIGKTFRKVEEKCPERLKTPVDDC